MEDLASESAKRAELESELNALREELVVARAAAQAAAQSDLPGVVETLQAEVRRLEDLKRQEADSLSHEKEMRLAAEEEAAAGRVESGRVREQLEKSLEKLKNTQEELTSVSRLKALADATAEASAGEVGARTSAQMAQLTADLEAEKRKRLVAEEKAAAAGDDSASTPVSPAFGRQMESLKKRVAQLEGELAAANARQQGSTSPPPSTSQTPPPSTLGDWNGTDASAAEYYQYQYSSASDNVSVLALLVQEAVMAHSWSQGGNNRNVLHYGQPHGWAGGNLQSRGCSYKKRQKHI